MPSSLRSVLTQRERLRTEHLYTANLAFLMRARQSLETVETSVVVIL